MKQVINLKWIKHYQPKFKLFKITGWEKINIRR